MDNVDDVDREAITRVTAELLAAVNAFDVDRCLAVWADDGVLMPPHHPAVRGRQALRDYFESLFSRSRFIFAFTSSQVVVAGNIAVERVAYAARIWTTSNALPDEDVGKGVHVYRRDPDGSWKLTQDIWNSDRPAPAA